MKIYRHNANKPKFTSVDNAYENALSDADKVKLKELKIKLEKASEGTDEEFQKAQKAYDDFLSKTNKKENVVDTPEITRLKEELGRAIQAVQSHRQSAADKEKQLQQYSAAVSDKLQAAYKAAKRLPKVSKKEAEELRYEGFRPNARSSLDMSTKANGKEGLTVAKLEVQLREVDSKIDPRRSISAQKSLFDERQKILDDISLLNRFPNFYKNNARRIFRK